MSINVHYQDGLGYQDYYLGKAWKKAGHEVHFVSSDRHFEYPDYERTVQHIIGPRYVGQGTFFNEYGVPVHRLRGTPKRFTGTIWLKNFGKTVRDLNADVIVSHGIFTWQSVRLLFMAPRLKARLIFDDHTTINLVRKSAVSNLVFATFRSLFAARFLKVADKLVGISATCIDVMRDYFGLSGPKVQMIPLGTDNELFRPDVVKRSAERLRIGASDDTVVVTYTGKMYWDKKVALLLEVLNDDAVTFGQSIIIHLVGSVAADYREVLQTAIAASKHRVLLEESKPIPALVAVYNAADICVWPDHLTNSTLDASACGCPIICSHYMPERVEGGGGMIVKAGDELQLKQALQSLINDPDLRRQMGLSGRKMIDETASWAAVAEKMIS